MRRVRVHPALTARLETAAAVHVLAAGKAAEPMLRGLLPSLPSTPGWRLAVASGGHAMGLGADWLVGSHPVPDERSTAAGCAALQRVQEAGPDDLVVVLLSGGASSLLALPAPGISLEDKRDTVRRLLLAGAPIRALNCVRKHLSSIKGGRLAAACRGTMLTVALSDVVGDDLSVIGSGPGMPDPSTYAEALAALERYGGTAVFPRAVVGHLVAGARGEVDESPKPGDVRLSKAHGVVAGGQTDALDAAIVAARQRGYRVHGRPDQVTGEARTAALEWVAWARRCLSADTGPVCLVSAGETTVHVRGTGRGGRNQEFTLAVALAFGQLGQDDRELAWASIGTDGVDGPTDAAGAVADTSTLARAITRGAQPAACALDENNSYDYFRRLDDLVMTGRTATNVGDLQLLLAAEKD